MLAGEDGWACTASTISSDLQRPTLGPAPIRNHNAAVSQLPMPRSLTGNDKLHSPPVATDDLSLPVTFQIKILALHSRHSRMDCRIFTERGRMGGLSLAPMSSR